MNKKKGAPPLGKAPPSLAGNWLTYLTTRFVGACKVMAMPMN